MRTLLLLLPGFLVCGGEVRTLAFAWLIFLCIYLCSVDNKTIKVMLYYLVLGPLLLDQALQLPLLFSHLLLLGVFSDWIVHQSPGSVGPPESKGWLLKIYTF